MSFCLANLWIRLVTANSFFAWLEQQTKVNKTCNSNKTINNT